MRVVDLFCGAGLASHGLHMAGLEILAGVDHWSTAAQSYKENFGRSHVCDIADVDSVMKAVGDTKPDVVWMSPPCTEHSNAKGGRPVNESVNMLAALAALAAKRLAPRFIVCENHPGILKHRVFHLMVEMLAGRAGDPGHVVFCLPSNVAWHSGLSEADATEALAELVQKCVIQDDGPCEMPGQTVREYQVMPWFVDADEWEDEE